MKAKYFILLIFFLVAGAVHASEPQWVLDGASRKPYLSCNQSRDNGLKLNWTQPVLEGSRPRGIENEGEIDGRVLFEGQNYASVVEWTLPIHDQRIGKLAIHLAANDMSRRSTLRVGTSLLIRDGSSEYGGQYWVYTSTDYRPSHVGSLISSIVNEDDLQDFDLKILISNGGSCYEEPVTYHFRRIR